MVIRQGSNLRPVVSATHGSNICKPYRYLSWVWVYVQVACLVVNCTHKRGEILNWSNFKKSYNYFVLGKQVSHSFFIKMVINLEIWMKVWWVNGWALACANKNRKVTPASRPEEGYGEAQGMNIKYILVDQAITMTCLNEDVPNFN